MPNPEIDPALVKLARAVAAEVMTRLSENPPLSKRWYNQVEAARYLGLEPRALETQRRERRGPIFSRPSRSLVRYCIADLDEWLRQNMVEPESAA